MGLWTRIKGAVHTLTDAAETVWDVTKMVWHWPVSGMLLSVGQVALNLTINLPMATGRYAIKSYKDQKNQKVLRHLTHIVSHDLVPLIMASYAAESLRQYLSPIDDDKEPEAFYQQMLTQTTLLSLYTFSKLFNLRQKQQTAVHQAIVMLEEGRAMTKPSMDICKTEECTTSRYLQGSLRDIVNYWTTTLSLMGLSYSAEWFLPSLLPAIQAALIYHNGRTILTNCLPICDRHKMEYLKEHAELALSLGIGHHYLNKGLVYGLSYSGIPTEHYHTVFSSALIIVTMGIAAELEFPKAVAVSKRTHWVDPIDAYQRGVGFVFDLVTFALKKKGPRIIRQFLENPTETSYLQTLSLLNKRDDVTLARKILTPPILHSPENFIADPLVKDNLPGLKSQAVTALSNIRRFRQDRTLSEEITTWGKEIWHAPWRGFRNMLIDMSLWTASLSPKKSSKLAQATKGLPKSIVELGLKALNDPAFMQKAEELEYYLQGLSNEPPAPLPQTTLLLAAPVATTLPPAAAPETVIKSTPPPPSSRVNPSSVIKDRTSRPSTAGMYNPRIIKRRPPSSAGTLPNPQEPTTI